jgi:hypothetical protein
MKFVLQNIIILKPILIYNVCDKDTIKFQIVTYLPLAKRGGRFNNLMQFFYKLKTGAQHNRPFYNDCS